MPRSARACADLPLDKVLAEYTKVYRWAGSTAWCSGRLFRRVDVRPYIRCLESRLGLAGPPFTGLGIPHHRLPTSLSACDALRSRRNPAVEVSRPPQCGAHAA